jgi:MFS family permease
LGRGPAPTLKARSCEATLFATIASLIRRVLLSVYPRPLALAQRPQNMAGNIGGALSPILFGRLVEFVSWQAPFIVAAGLLMLGVAVWAFWLDPDVSVLERKSA